MTNPDDTGVFDAPERSLQDLEEALTNAVAPAAGTDDGGLPGGLQVHQLREEFFEKHADLELRKSEFELRQSIETAEREMRERIEQHAKNMQNQDLRHRVRKAWADRIAASFWLTIRFVLVVLTVFAFMDLYAARNPADFPNHERFVTGGVLLSLIGATIAQLAALALAVSNWGFGPAPPADPAKPDEPAERPEPGT